MVKDKAIDPEQIQLFRGLENLPPTLWTDLLALNPRERALRASVNYDPESGYLLHFMGGDFLINPEKRTIKPGKNAWRPGFQAGLVMLNYLTHAAEHGLAGRMVTERELNGGELFFKGPHALSKESVIRRYARDGAAMLDRALAWGAVKLEGGEAAFRLVVLPKIVVAYTLYEADDEFPAELTVTFDANTDRHLSLDAVWSMINIMSARLAE